MVSRTAPERRLLLVFVALMSMAAPVGAAEYDAERVFRATRDFLEPGRFREVHDLLPGADGTLWLVGVDWGWWGAQKAWYARHLTGEGVRLGGDIHLSFEGMRPRFRGSVTPIGTTPDGSLVVCVDDGQILEYLGRVAKDGSSELRPIAPYSGPPLVDRSGVVHVASDLSYSPSYRQIDMRAPGLPLTGRPDPTVPGDSVAFASGGPEWLSSWRSKPVALLSEDPDRILIAARDSDTLFRLYRVDAKTLSVVGSGVVSPARDAYRTWRGPVKLGLVLVPVGRSGYWLFSPTGDTPPAPTGAVYRLREDLSVVRPHAVAAGEVQPFAAAPAAAVVTTLVPYSPPNKQGRVAVTVKLAVSFAAHGSDGQLYYQQFVDSVASRAMK